MMQAYPKLIVNVDDFGPNEEVAQRTMRAFKASRITRASALVNFSWPSNLADQVHRIKLPLGVHLNISTGKPVCPKNTVPSLVEESGYFSPRNRTFDLHHIDPEELYLEFEAQIKKFRDLGFRPAHLDNHRPEIYLNPKLFSICIKIAKRHAISLRNPLHGMDSAQIKSISVFYGLKSENLLTLQRQYDHEFRENGLKCPDFFINDYPSTDFESYFHNALESAKGKTIELCVHLEGNIGAMKSIFLLSKEFENIISQRFELVTPRSPLGY